MPTRSQPIAAVALRRYEVLVRPGDAAQSWRATLVCDGGTRRIDFESPEALARHLAQETAAEPRRGLR